MGFTGAPASSRRCESPIHAVATRSASNERRDPGDRDQDHKVDRGE